MKRLLPVQKRAVCVTVLVCLAFYVLLSAAGLLFDCNLISIPAAVRQANDYEVRGKLLMTAMDRVGVCDPLDAADVWASGLVERSAALQYAVMDEKLKAVYAMQLEEKAPNWVTGISSPWVDSYYFEKTESPDEGTKIVCLVFRTATSAGADSYYKAVLTIVKEECFWRIAGIEADKGLYPYTLFNP
jgi:hypothetical protein